MAEMHECPVVCPSCGGPAGGCGSKHNIKKRKASGVAPLSQGERPSIRPTTEQVKASQVGAKLDAQPPDSEVNGR